MMRSKASKDSSRGFQVSSEISFLISVRKALPTSGQTVDVTSKFFSVWKSNKAVLKGTCVVVCVQLSKERTK